MANPNVSEGARGSIPAHLQPMELYALAQRDRQSWSQIAEHPNAYPALLDWLDQNGNASVKQAVARRRGLTPPAAPAPGPSVAKHPAVPKAKTPTDSEVSAPTPDGKASATPRRLPVARPAPTGPATADPAPSVPAKPTGSRVKAARAADTPAMEPVDDKTVLAKRRKQPLALLSWGEAPPVPLQKPIVVIGRRAKSDDQDVQVVQVDDPTKTVSGTHARLELVDGVWMIEDLGSTNGVFLVVKDGEEEAKGRVNATDDFYLGDVRFHLEPSAKSRNDSRVQE